VNLKKIGKVFTSKFAGTGPSSYEKRIYQAAVSQRLRNTDVKSSHYSFLRLLMLQAKKEGHFWRKMCCFETSYFPISWKFMIRICISPEAF